MTNLMTFGHLLKNDLIIQSHMWKQNSTGKVKCKQTMFCLAADRRHPAEREKPTTNGRREEGHLINPAPPHPVHAFLSPPPPWTPSHLPSFSRVPRCSCRSGGLWQDGGDEIIKSLGVLLWVHGGDLCSCLERETQTYFTFSSTQNSWAAA